MPFSLAYQNLKKIKLLCHRQPESHSEHQQQQEQDEEDPVEDSDSEADVSDASTNE